MPRRVAIILNSIVDNVVLIEPGQTWMPPEAATIVEDPDGKAQIGGAVVGGVFMPAPEPGAPAPSTADRLVALEKRMEKPYSQRIATANLTMAGTAVSAMDLIGFSGVMRVAAGRYRFTFAVTQPDAAYIVLVTTFNTAATRQAFQVLAKSATFIEIAVTNIVLTGLVAGDPMEIALIVERTVK